MTPSSNAGDEQIDEILAELFDRGERLGASKWVSNDEKAHAVSEAKAAIQAYTAKQVREALEKVRAEILSLTTGGPRGVEASADIVTKAIANQGVLPNSNEGGEK